MDIIGYSSVVTLTICFISDIRSLLQKTKKAACLVNKPDRLLFVLLNSNPAHKNTKRYGCYTVSIPAREYIKDVPLYEGILGGISFAVSIPAREYKVIETAKTREKSPLVLAAIYYSIFGLICQLL